MYLEAYQLNCLASIQQNMNDCDESRLTIAIFCIGAYIFLVYCTFSLLWIPGSDVIVEWVIDRGVVEGVWQCVTDGESYVRAAALTSLGLLSEVSRVWEHISVTIGQVLGRSVLFVYVFRLFSSSSI